MNFKDRVITQELSPEFIESYAGLEGDAARNRVEEAAKRLERSYAAVAMVEKHTDYYGDKPGYRVRVVPKHNAEVEEIQHGVQSVMRWVANADEE